MQTSALIKHAADDRPLSKAFSNTLRTIASSTLRTESLEYVVALSPITTTRSLTIPLSVSFFYCLSKTTRLESLSGCRDETLIISRRLPFFKSERTIRPRFYAVAFNSWNHSPRRLLNTAQVCIYTHSCASSLLADPFEPLLPVMIHFIYIRRHRMCIRPCGILLVSHFVLWPDFLEGALGS